MNILEGLNEAQKRVVVHEEGPLLVLAGAGAGKTKAITHRIAHLISRGVPPEAIVAITFTNKAAREMRERVARIVRSEEQPVISTFHALGVSMLRSSLSPKRFSILDREDSLALLKTVMADLGVDPKEFAPSRVLNVLSRMKGDLADAADVHAYVHSPIPLARHLPRIREAYESRLRESRAYDFDDLIEKPVRLLRDRGDIRAHYEQCWQHRLIDEYQDTTHVQYELARLLAGRHRNITAVGDIDQAIYSWRGADYRNIMRFEEDYPERALIFLEENYRSPANILEAADRVIEKNVDRKPKRLIPTREEGAPITFFVAAHEDEEAEHIAARASKLISSGTNASEVAVLYRANFQSRALEEACLKEGIPYQVLGTRFYERREVKDILAYLRAAINPHDHVSVSRVINVPARGIGRATLLSYLKGSALSPAQERKVAAFHKILGDIRGAAETKRCAEAVRAAIETSGYEDDDLERFENLAELVLIAGRYATVEQLLDAVALMGEQDTLREEKEGVRLMTVHAAKGLEFEHVFVAGLEDGLFPHRGTDDDRIKDEEERRLFYVAMTRAKECLHLSFSLTRSRFGAANLTTPSSFLSDIPEHLIEVERDARRAVKHRVFDIRARASND